MTPRQQNELNNLQIKAIKTAALFALCNIICGLICRSDNSSNGAAILIANMGLVLGLHELGKHRRPGANAINRVMTLFSANTGVAGRDFDNAIRNTINGGAAIMDELNDSITTGINIGMQRRP